MKSILMVGALTMCCAAVHADTFRIEAEQLDQQGKWQIGKHVRVYSDGKSVIAMESKAVLSGSYKLDKAGKYQVWVRTETRGQNWRKGLLSINGKELGSFGDEPLKEGQKSGSWHWIRLGEIELEAGKIELKITTPKGYVRADAIVLSDEESYTPPEKPVDIVKIPELALFD